MKGNKKSTGRENHKNNMIDEKSYLATRRCECFWRFVFWCENYKQRSCVYGGLCAHKNETTSLVRTLSHRLNLDFFAHHQQPTKRTDHTNHARSFGRTTTNHRYTDTVHVDRERDRYIKNRSSSQTCIAVHTQHKTYSTYHSTLATSRGNDNKQHNLYHIGK